VWDGLPDYTNKDYYFIAVIRLSVKSIDIGCPCIVDGFNPTTIKESFAEANEIGICSIMPDSLPRLDTINRTLTIYFNSVLITKGKHYHLLEDLIINLGTEQYPLADDIKVYYSPAEGVKVTVWDGLPDYTNKDYYFIAVIRLSVKSIDIGCPCIVDGFNPTTIPERVIGKNSNAYTGSQILPFNLLNYENKAKQGVVLEIGTGDSYDNYYVESPCIWYEPSIGKLIMIFTAYSNSTGVLIASHGWATSSDGINWEKQGQFFRGSGIAGAPDEAGCTGPVMVIEDGVYHLFYIALDEPGYEGGTKTLCLATGTSIYDFINNTATRHGVVVSPSGTSWHSSAIWHPNFVKYDGLWYLFMNATGSDGKERTGYAVSESLTGNWEFNEQHLLDYIDESTRMNIVAGDPSIIKIDNWFIMMYFTTYDNGSGVMLARDEWAYTTSDKFPLGWRYGGIGVLPDAEYDNVFAHKPWLMQFNNRIYHYYTSVGNSVTRQISLIY
jgi:hypothetical protein